MGERKKIKLAKKVFIHIGTLFHKELYTLARTLGNKVNMLLCWHLEDGEKEGLHKEEMTK